MTKAVIFDMGGVPIDNRFQFDRSLADYEIDRIEDLLGVELFREIFK